jgi:hypothetical protein
MDDDKRYVCLNCGYASTLHYISPNAHGIFKSNHAYQPEDGRYSFPDYNTELDCGDDFDGNDWFICEKCGDVEFLDYGGDGLCKNCYDQK